MPNTENTTAEVNTLTFKAAEFDGFEFPSYLNNFSEEELKGATIKIDSIEEAQWLTDRRDDATQKISKFIERIGRNVISTIQLDGESEVKDLVIPIGTLMTSKGVVCAAAGDVDVPDNVQNVSKVLKAIAVKDGQTTIPTHIRVLRATPDTIKVAGVDYPKYRYSDYEEHNADAYSVLTGVNKTKYSDNLITTGTVKENRNPSIKVVLGLITA